MSDVALIPIVWIRTVAFAAALIIVGVFCLGRCSKPTPPGLPTKVQAHLVEHEIRTIIDSQRVQALEATVAQLQAKAHDEKEMREGTQAFAQRERDRGDSLEAAARIATTAADSAEAWHRAHDARKREADSLRVAGHLADSIITQQSGQLVAKDAIISVEKARAARADSSIAELLPLAMRAGDECKILWVLNCPSRKVVAATAAAVTAGGIYVAKKGIRIRLPIG